MTNNAAIIAYMCTLYTMYMYMYMYIHLCIYVYMYVYNIHSLARELWLADILTYNTRDHYRVSRA